MEANKGEVILLIGGARSGKSALAEKLVSEFKSVAYIATAEASDDEMKDRIRKHRKSRPVQWATYEVVDRLDEALKEACGSSEAAVVDCLTMYVAKLMERTIDDNEVVSGVVRAVKEAKKTRKAVIFVSNEVGMGLVPDYPVGRRYRDLLGIVNQKVAALADKVFLIVAGIPIDIKELEFKMQN